MKLLLMFVGFFGCCFVSAQQLSFPKNTFYLFNKEDKPVSTLGEAATFEVVSKMSDTLYLVRYYENYGPMIWQQSYKDSALSEPSGRFVWYDKEGNIDSTVIYENGQKSDKTVSFDSIAKHKIESAFAAKNKIGKNYVYDISEAYSFPALFFKHKDDGAFFTSKKWIKYLKEKTDPALGTKNDIYDHLSGRDAVEIICFKNNRDLFFVHSAGFVYDENLLKTFLYAPVVFGEILKHRSFSVMQKFVFPHQYK